MVHTIQLERVSELRHGIPSRRPSATFEPTYIGMIESGSSGKFALRHSPQLAVLLQFQAKYRPLNDQSFFHLDPPCFHPCAGGKLLPHRQSNTAPIDDASPIPVPLSPM